MGEGLYGFLQNYAAQGAYPFHMPGHKRNPAFLPPSLATMDVTEIPGTDNLHQPDGLILQLQERLACLFGAEQSFLMVNGSTGGNLAAITALCGEGAAVLMARNAHRSAFGALVLSGARPVYVMPSLTEHGFCGSVSPAGIEAQLRANPDVRAVFITSPTYEGAVSDVAAIAKIAHTHGVPLIVDEAHGAHMGFSDIFPRTALACGADVVIQSLHKTLPFLSQTSVLHIQGSLVDHARLKKMLAIVQTSSPSYILMAQADYALAMLEKDGAALFRAYADRLSACREALGGLRNIRLFTDETIDVSKLVFLLPDGLPGRVFEAKLREEFRVQLEMSGLSHGIALTSPADTDEGFERLLQGVKSMDAAWAADDARGTKAAVPMLLPAMPDAVLSPRAAANGETTLVPLTGAEGRIAADFLIPYPPGIPLAAPGERLTRAILDGLHLCTANGIPVVGLDSAQTRLSVIRVVSK